MSIGTSHLLNAYKHIHLLNGYSLPKNKGTLFKYIPLERFVQSVDSNELVFVSPIIWNDPFEQFFLNIDLSKRGYPKEDIACMCVSEKSSKNEDACWRVYGESKKAVRVSIKYDELFRLLEDYSSANECEVYVGKVVYSLRRKEIEELCEDSSKHHKYYFPKKMSREHYLSLMLLKRDAFDYENEVRIFLVKNKLQFDDKKLIHLNCDYKKIGILENVMLSPYPPVNPLQDLAFSVRKKINEKESSELKRILHDKLQCKIYQSRLYEVRDVSSQILDPEKEELP